jgi:hypothetical protein
MHYTLSQARAQAAEEAQASLLCIVTAQVATTHASSLENLEISSPLLTILEDILLKFIVACRVSISTIKLAFLLLVILFLD